MHLKETGFVRDLGSRTSLNWRRIFLYLGVLAVGVCLAQIGFSYFFEDKFQWLMVVPPIAAWMIVLIVSIELQRQRLVVGHWRWRFSLAGILWVTFFVAVLLASALRMAHNTQREFAFGKKVVDAVQEITRGYVYSQSRGGRFMVVVTRADFNDDDLARVIDAATADGESNSRIASLMIWGTAVTDQGLAKLERCPQLEALSTSVGPFSEATQSRLYALKRLKDFTLDDSKFSEAELERLRQNLPRTRFNGR